MDDTRFLDQLTGAPLPEDRRRRLLASIEAVFERAIEARAPGNRPPGKAGLRAEKGYFRLLYLLDELRGTSRRGEPPDPEADGERLAGILRRLTDIPDLRAEILAGIVAALDEVTSPGRPPGRRS